MVEEIGEESPSVTPGRIPAGFPSLVANSSMLLFHITLKNVISGVRGGHTRNFNGGKEVRYRGIEEDCESG